MIFFDIWKNYLNKFIIIFDALRLVIFKEMYSILISFCIFNTLL